MTPFSNDFTTHQIESSISKIAGIVCIYVLVFWGMLPALLVATGLKIDVLWPVALPASIWVTSAGWLLTGIGVAVMLASMLQLWYEGHGLPISHLPPTRLVTGGVFHAFRHPIYVGYTLALMGVALLISSFWTLSVSTPLLLIGWICYARFYEEPALLERYGAEYIAHRDKTPLLFRIPIPALIQSFFQVGRNGLLRLLERLANWPILFQKGHLILVTYGLFCALGGLLWAESLSMSLTMQGLSSGATGWFVTGITLAISFGAALFWWLGQWRTLIKEPWWGLGRIGFVSFGGLLVASIFVALFAWVQQVHVLMLLDAMMQGMYFSYAFGRIGCLTYGCCYGACTTDQHFGVVYRHPEAKMIRESNAPTCSRYPVQFYAFLHGLIVVAAIAVFIQSSVPAGTLTAITLILGGFGRTITEFFRDRERVIGNLLTAGHIGSFTMMATGWAILFTIDTVQGGPPPVPWSQTAFVESAHLLPVVIGCSFFILIVYGVHWKRMGYRFGG